MSRIDSLQLLRAVAASMVVFFHACDLVARSASADTSVLLGLGAWPRIGAAGVDLFFVLSGFVMVYVHASDFGRPGASAAFLQKRLARIVPTYWLLTGLAVALLIVAPQLFHYDRNLDWTWIGLSFLFVPWVSDSGVSMPVLGLGWTLNYEMYFYLCFAVLLPLPRRVFFPVLCAAFAAAVAIGEILRPEHPLPRMLTSWLLIEFLIGCLIGAALGRGIALPRFLGCSLFVPAVALLVLSPSAMTDDALPGALRLIFWGVPAALVLSCVALVPSFRHASPPSLLVALGDASYAIYLTHVFTLPAFALAMAKLGADLPPDARIIAAFLGALLVGWVFYVTVELPIQRRLRRRRLPVPAVA